jgi:hypothetical protein
MQLLLIWHTTNDLFQLYCFFVSKPVWHAVVLGRTDNSGNLGTEQGIVRVQMFTEEGIVFADNVV